MVATKGATSTTPTFYANTLINGAPWWLPTILTSVDHATTWQVCCPATCAPRVLQPALESGPSRLQVVTGFGPVPTWSTTTAPTLAAPVSYPNFAPGASTSTTLLLSGITSYNSQPLSLNSVFCATKSLCFAVGGFISGYPSQLSIVQANIYTYGTVLVSTNGGTFWNVRSHLPHCPSIWQVHTLNVFSCLSLPRCRWCLMPTRQLAQPWAPLAVCCPSASTPTPATSTRLAPRPFSFQLRRLGRPSLLTRSRSRLILAWGTLLAPTGLPPLPPEQVRWLAPFWCDLLCFLVLSSTLAHMLLTVSLFVAVLWQRGRLLPGPVCAHRGGLLLPAGLRVRD